MSSTDDDTDDHLSGVGTDLHPLTTTKSKNENQHDSDQTEFTTRSKDRKTSSSKVRKKHLAIKPPCSRRSRYKTKRRQNYAAEEDAIKKTSKKDIKM